MTEKRRMAKAELRPPTLERNRVCDITYACRDIGYGVEGDTVRAYWTGEVDTWGKYTIVPVEHRDGMPLYLFLDEIKEVTEP
jgi:hypothetical protein